ncbi:uncharacterized protein LOC129008642 [Pongo pygmaeus]|uniref:uncharacterized protein LOC129008642 n=1 Tax=Pongo pygmaeus TaxID=9600 RepID=UPI000273DA20|nr:uncharacterized protein LOC100939714 isoform X2 [Pongo abelii]XP_054296988.1 uncharacterized protein LOC129008642 [Pongo pygmaeus]XP_054380630.1 uncharacterized protein LOC100939714 isoform X2 [Pongo abelii]
MLSAQGYRLGHLHRDPIRGWRGRWSEDKFSTLEHPNPTVFTSDSAAAQSAPDLRPATNPRLVAGRDQRKGPSSVEARPSRSRSHSRSSSCRATLVITERPGRKQLFSNFTSSVGADACRECRFLVTARYELSIPQKSSHFVSSHPILLTNQRLGIICECRTTGFAVFL